MKRRKKSLVIDNDVKSLQVRLNPRQKKFAEHFVLVRNRYCDLTNSECSAKALALAGFKTYDSEEISQSIGTRLLANKKIADYIRSLDPDALTPQIKGSLTSSKTQDIILNALSNGMPRSEAAKLAAVSSQVLNDWLRKGENSEGYVYSSFFHKVRKAEAQFHYCALNIISEAATRIRTKKKTKTVYGLIPVKTKSKDTNGETTQIEQRMISKEVIEEEIPPDWSAAAWLLERKYADYWNTKNAENHMDPRDVARKIQMAIIEIDRSIPEHPDKYIDIVPEEKKYIENNPQSENLEQKDTKDEDSL